MPPETRAASASGSSDVDARIAALEAQLAALLNQSAQQNNQNTPKSDQPRFPHPKAFHGEYSTQNPQKLSRFISQLQDKLAVDYSTSPKATKIAYTVSRLDGLA